MDATIENGLQLLDGKKIPRIAFGTFDLDAQSEAQQAVENAIDAGWRHIDCARFYANEAAVGRALEHVSLDRSQLFITSKVWNDRQIDGTVRQSVEESLTDLKLDYLDLLLIHWPVENCFVDTWHIFEQMQDEGLVKSIGVSNFHAEHLKQLISHSDTKPVIDQLEIHPFMRDFETIRYCESQRIVLEAWSPLGRGTCLSHPRICSIAERHEATSAQVILAWHLAHCYIALPRSSKAQNISSNLLALNLSLTQEEIDQIDELNQNKPVIEGIDPKHFASHLNALSSHF